VPAADVEDLYFNYPYYGAARGPGGGYALPATRCGPRKLDGTIVLRQRALAASSRRRAPAHDDASLTNPPSEDLGLPHPAKAGESR
jgi:hypothetical protein